jgi:hypothetical protein
MIQAAISQIQVLYIRILGYGYATALQLWQMQIYFGKLAFASKSVEKFLRWVKLGNVVRPDALAALQAEIDAVRRLECSRGH